MPEPTIDSFEPTIAQIKAELDQLPPNELGYYFALLTGSIALEDYSAEKQQLLDDIRQMIAKLRAFNDAARKGTTPLTAEEQAALDTANKELFEALNTLLTHTKMNTWTYQTKRILYAMCAFVLTILTATLVGVIGMVAGFFSHFNVVDNFRGAYLGLCMGVGIGIHIGQRAPHKIFRSAFENRLEFAVDSINRITQEELAKEKSYEAYAKETEEYIKDTFYAHLTSPEEREAAFQKFISEPHKFQVCTSAAGFVSPRLRGYFGQHSLIRYNVEIEGKEVSATMEFNPGTKAPETWELNQFEPEREVDGPTFFKMLVLNRILNETHEFTLNFMLEHFNVGANDCKTFVDKLLKATGQAPSKIQRFCTEPGVEKWQSTVFVAPTMRFFNVIKGDEMGLFDDGVERKITAQKFVKLSPEEKKAFKAREAEERRKPKEEPDTTPAPAF